MPARSGEGDRDPLPESLFAGWLARREQGDETDLEAICRAHPEAVERLRTLERQYIELEELKRRFGLAGSVAERLAASLGSEIDPKIELEGEDTGDFTSKLIGRLSGRSPASSRYRLKGEVASGGMGAILRVWDEDLRRHLAMKVVLGHEPPSSGQTPPVDRRLLARFLEEAQVTGQLDHPGIVPVHELGVDPQGHVYFTMKLVKGRDLKAIFDLVREGKEGWNQVKALGVLLKVCQAMSYAHDKGVIHRDLKPANVMVGRYGEVYVMDWGLARILGRTDDKDIRLRPIDTSGPSAIRTDRKESASDAPDSPLYTMDGDVVGTPAYMPPEQAAGSLDSMGPHSDVYAVGAMLYHLLAGHMPYVREGEKASTYMVLRWVKDGPPHALEKEAPNASAELAAICDQAMSRDIRSRYASMAALAADLSAYLEGKVVAAYETGTWAEGKKWIQRNKALAAAAATALVATLAGGVAFAVKADQAALAAVRATENAKEATRLKDEALQRERELRVRGLIQDLAEFEALDDSLEFARSEVRPAHEWWPERARMLITGSAEDLRLGVRWRPGLADAEEQLARLRSQGLEPTEQEVAADRNAFPRAEELAHKQCELQWHRRMLGLEGWPDEASTEAELSSKGILDTVGSLTRAAWQRVNPEDPMPGKEIEAVVLAKAALQRAVERRRAEVRTVLAWALYRAGRFDEALEQARMAAVEAQGEDQETVRRLQESISAWQDGRSRTTLEVLSGEVARLEELAARRRSWRFADNEHGWWHRQLTQVVDDLRRLQERVAIVERSTSEAEVSATWSKAIAAIESSPMYAGLSITPQIGLLPIGPDPDSGLWEFAHLQSGEAADRKSDGRLELTPETGLVFVLLPGGKYWMGAQAQDPSERNYDPSARPVERPVHEVELTPFFLSKFEMTRGQWRRVAHWVPRKSLQATLLTAGEDDSLEPITSVSWDDCAETLATLDAWIQLPSEAQWEYACRGGTNTPWWTGDSLEDLRGQENIPIAEDPFETRLVQPVGSLDSNPYGLHDMHGNIFEWCQDEWYELHWTKISLTDPVAPTDTGAQRVIRGGYYRSALGEGRSSHRSKSSSGNRNPGVGVRPARVITP